MSVLSHSESELYSVFFFFLNSNFVRKILKNFENCSQSVDQLANRIIWFNKFYFPEQQLGHSASFVSVLTRSELELYTHCFVGFLTM